MVRSSRIGDSARSKIIMTPDGTTALSPSFGTELASPSVVAQDAAALQRFCSPVHSTMVGA